MKHYDPQSSEILQRFRFHTRFRKQEESVENYVSVLRLFTQKCNFKAGTMDEMLRDWLVCGISEDNIQRRLLSEAKLTYEKALELAHSMEAAMKSAKEIQNTSANQKEESTAQPAPSEQVHQLQSEASRKGQEPCYRCGGTNHVSSQCHFIGKHCFNRGKLGHTARVCRSKKLTQQQNTRNSVRVVQMDSPKYYGTK